MDDLSSRVDKYNDTKKSNWPKLVYDQNWMYGVWYCSRSFQKQKYYGQYPLTYLTRIRLLFGDIKPLVHLFSGAMISVEGEITVDNDRALNPTYCCEADNLPFESNSIGCIVADPPYSTEDAKKYTCRKYPKMSSVFKECSRVLKVGGYLVFLHTHLLQVSKSNNLHLRGTIGILTGTNAKTRLCAIYRKEV
jgi:SAM-dependent methyltransferase